METIFTSKTSTQTLTAALFVMAPTWRNSPHLVHLLQTLQGKKCVQMPILGKPEGASTGRGNPAGMYRLSDSHLCKDTSWRWTHLSPSSLRP